MICVDFSTVLNHGAFMSGNLPNGDRIFWSVSTNEIVAIKARDGSTACAYQRLSPDEMKALAATEFFGGILVSQRGLPFQFDDLLNDARWAAKVNELHGFFKSLLQPPPPGIPEGVKTNGHTLSPEELAKVQTVRPDLTRAQQAVKE